MGCFTMPKGVPNKRYKPEFKRLVVATMQKEKLSYTKTTRRFEVNNRHRIQNWNRIYLQRAQKDLQLSGEDESAPIGQRRCRKR